MAPHQLFAVVLGLSAVNGIFSPYLVVVLAFSPLWAPSWLPAGSPGALFYLSSMIVATTTLLLSGVPAALVERAHSATRGTPLPMYVWVATALVLTLPAIIRILAFAGGG